MSSAVAVSSVVLSPEPTRCSSGGGSTSRSQNEDSACCQRCDQPQGSSETPRGDSVASNNTGRRARSEDGSTGARSRRNRSAGNRRNNRRNRDGVREASSGGGLTASSVVMAAPAASRTSRSVSSDEYHHQGHGGQGPGGQGGRRGGQGGQQREGSVGSSSSRQQRRRRRRRRRSGHGNSSVGPSQGTTPTTYEDLLRTNMSNPSNRNNGNGSRPNGGGRHQRGNQQQPTANARNGGQLPSSPAEEEALKSQIRKWPHNLSFLFAAFSATIGMFSISRFAVLTVEFGAVFIVQFLFLSLAFGIPMMLFFCSMGQYLGSGIIDMWRISPIFQGIGVALMLAQGVYSVYNIAAISWMFIYFRDSFITAWDRYRWSFCFSHNEYGRNCESPVTSSNSSASTASTAAPDGWRMEQTIPDYFSGSVLLRTSPTYPHTFTGELRFQTLFNIVVIWMAVFIGLSKGLKSYGKVVYLTSSLSLLGFLVFATKIIDVLPLTTFKVWLVNTSWIDYSGESWVSAARETFFTWGILGATMLQLASHNRFKHPLARDATILSVITLVVLVLSGMVGLSTVSLIKSYGYIYVPSSFETIDSYQFLQRRDSSVRAMRGGREYSVDSIDPFASLRERQKMLGDNFILNSLHDQVQAKKKSRVKRFSGHSNRWRRTQHVSFLAGIRILDPKRSSTKYSGYQVMRLATELIPSYSAILGPKLLSPFWVVLFYFTMILFGLAQQMALVHTVSSGLIAIRPDHFLHFESSLTFMSCLLGLVFSFPMATEFGEFIVYFFDYTIGCGWWMMVLYVLQLFAIFIIRGRPYHVENVASVLIEPNSCCSKAILSTLAFIWNIVLPIGLVILAIVSFSFGRFDEMFDWTTHSGYLYLPSWVREIGAMMQLLPILLVPFVAVIQSCRYFMNSSSGERLHERVNNLYRPSFRGSRGYGNGRNGGGHQHSDVVLTNYNPSSGTRPEPIDDPPPKYTPPPSYSTATGARIARMLRQSFRRLRGAGGEDSIDAEALTGSEDRLVNTSSTRLFPVARSKGLPGQDHLELAVAAGAYSMVRLANQQQSGHGGLQGPSSLQTTAAVICPDPPDYATVIIEHNAAANSRNRRSPSLTSELDTNSSVMPLENTLQTELSSISTMTINQMQPRFEGAVPTPALQAAQHLQQQRLHQIPHSLHLETPATPEEHFTSIPLSSPPQIYTNPSRSPFYEVEYASILHLRPEGQTPPPPTAINTLSTLDDVPLTAASDSDPKTASDTGEETPQKTHQLTSELPVESEYVTVASVLAAAAEQNAATPSLDEKSHTLGPEETPVSLAANGLSAAIDVDEGEDLSLGESLVLGDGILNNLSCDLTEDLNGSSSPSTVVSLCSSRPLNLVNNSFVMADETAADQSSVMANEAADESSAQNDLPPSINPSVVVEDSSESENCNNRTIKIEMDTTASVI